MSHDPLCGWSSDNDCEASQPHKDFPEGTNGYRWRICDRCGYECECQLIATAYQHMLARCIAAVEALHDHQATHNAHRDTLWDAIVALRALQDQP